MKNTLICLGAIGFAVSAIAFTPSRPFDEKSAFNKIAPSDGDLFLAQAAPTCSPTPDDQD